MIGHVRPRWVLLGGCAGLALVIGIEVGSLPSDAALPASATVTAAAPSETLARYTPPPEAQFQEIAERPLFVPDRRPQRDEPRQTAPPPPPPFTVEGVVLSTEHRTAVIQYGRPPKRESVAEGDSVDGWHVTRIERDSIALSNGGNSVSLPVWTGQKLTETAASPERRAPAAVPPSRP